MRLIVEWVNATRPPDERVRVEATICNSILDFYEGGVERAKKSHDNFQRGKRGPFQDWARAVYYGHRSTKCIITPTEYGRLAFKATFDEGVN